MPRPSPARPQRHQGARLLRNSRAGAVYLYLFAATSASPDCRERPGRTPGRACACACAGAAVGRQQPDLRRRLLRGRRDRCGRSRRGSLPHSAVGCKLCVRAVRAVRIGAESREGGGCGGGFPAGGAGGAGRRTVAWLASVSIATTGAVGAAAVADSSAPRWRGCDQSDRLRRKRRARGERGVGTGAPASLLELLLPQRASPPLLTSLFFEKPFLPISRRTGEANERN